MDPSPIHKTKMKKYVAEFIGTFFLVLTVGCTVYSGCIRRLSLQLAIGAALMVYGFLRRRTYFRRSF